jgi:arsenite methyltransferase
MNSGKISKNVKSGYADILKRNTTKPLLSNFFQCCDPKFMERQIGNKIGYSNEEIDMAPQDSNLGIGCGNPTALASIKEGEIILDLGSGAGFDCFLASKLTGEQGRVIGVDITPEMVSQAQKNAVKGNYSNIEFKVGEIENLPIDNNSIDLIISNCVINLSDHKEKVFEEAFRVLKTGGRIMISDIILLNELPDFIKNSVEGYLACIAGAITKDYYISSLKIAGFEDIKIDKQTSFPIELMLHDPIAKKIIKDNNLTGKEISEIADSIASITLSARKNKY